MTGSAGLQMPVDTTHGELHTVKMRHYFSNGQNHNQMDCTSKMTQNRAAGPVLSAILSDMHFWHDEHQVKISQFCFDVQLFYDCNMSKPSSDLDQPAFLPTRTVNGYKTEDFPITL